MLLRFYLPRSGGLGASGRGDVAGVVDERMLP